MSSQRQFPPNSTPVLPYGMQPQHISTFMSSSNTPNPPVPGTIDMSRSQQSYPNCVQQQNRFSIGRPIILSEGPLAGLTVRMELHEIQKAELGRRYGKIDRRPIDPPPVILLRIFEVKYAGTSRQQEREIRYNTAQTIGLICTVDLFPVPGSGDSSIPQPLANTTPDAAQETFPPNFLQSSLSFQAPYYSNNQQNQNFYALNYNPGQYVVPEVARFNEEAINYVNGYPVLESSKQTQALAGNTFVQPIVAEYGGRDSILFVFNDLSVKLEGHFILRYRVFDIYSQEHASDTSNRSVMAECFGGVFKMYPSKTFPGLPPSTELTKYLAMFNGTRVNVRNEERHRRI